MNNERRHPIREYITLATVGPGLVIGLLERQAIRINSQLGLRLELSKI